MKWKGRRQSGNVEDRRGQSGKRGGFSFPGGRGGLGGLGGGRGAGGRGIPRVGRRGGLGVIIVFIVMMLLGVDPMALLGGGGLTQPQMGGSSSSGPRPARENEMAQFTAVVLADTEDVWNAAFKTANGNYSEPSLVLFTDATRSGCGTGKAAMGPFYCPADRKIYIDLGFFDQLHQRFGAPGDFAQAYVIAHEVGHHVQNLTGQSDKVHEARSRLSKADYNAMSVRLELQADCYAGYWAHHAQRTKNILDPGDIDEALKAATAIGDDTLQRQAQGRVVPESFTHGTSAQRQRWFRTGYETGNLGSCDTFSIAQP